MLTASKIKFTTSADVDRQVREQLAAGNGLYSVDKLELCRLRPDVVVTQSLCKVCSVDNCLVEDITSGMDPRPILVDTNPTNLSEVLRDVQRVADAVGLPKAGEAAVAKMKARIKAAVDTAKEMKSEDKEAPKVGFCEVSRGASHFFLSLIILNQFYTLLIAFILIIWCCIVLFIFQWTDPIFCGGHWTPELIEMAGGQHPLNPCKDGGGAGPSFTVPGENFASLDPDIIVVACCGFDIPTTLGEMKPLVEQPWWGGLKAVKEDKVWVVDGNQASALKPYIRCLIFCFHFIYQVVYRYLACLFLNELLYVSSLQGTKKCIFYFGNNGCFFDGLCRCLIALALV